MINSPGLKVPRRSGAFARTILRTPSGGTIKTVERGRGAAVVFLHSGVGSAGEWRGCVLAMA